MARAMCTVPMGFCGDPPWGPAMPVMAMAIFAFDFLRVFWAMCFATCGETAPWSCMILGSMPSCFILNWLW